jgi:hypothetical protein
MVGGTLTRAWSIEIPGFVPPSVNRLLGLHWGKRGRVKRGVADTIALASYASGDPVPDAVRKRRVSVSVTVSGRGGLIDPDNALKCLLDALKANRLLVDDSAKWCEIGEVTVERGPETRTRIILEDIR